MSDSQAVVIFTLAIVGYFLGLCLLAVLKGTGVLDALAERIRRGGWRK